VGKSPGATRCDEQRRYQASLKPKTAPLDFTRASSPRRTERRPFANAFAGRHRHPAGTWGQVLGRGLVPRLSIGTLQLSIRCSSIHFLPSRSFPVSDRGVFDGKLAALDVGRSSGLSWADAGHASQIANTETNDGLNQGAMHGLVNL